MFKNFLFIFLTIFSSAFAGHEDIAQNYAPTIYQNLGSDPRADEFTRVDFDGDWNPDNNWVNMPKFNRPATVYWDVVDSDEYYFITYAFFYPRDYASWCFFIHCHENDFEGMRVTVKKPATVLRLETLAHNFKTDVDSPLLIEVTIEKEGHGIHPTKLVKPDERYKKYVPQDYKLRPLQELWILKDQNLFTGSFEFKGKSYPSNFGGKKWILFGLGAAKPPWAWEIWQSDIKKGQWFLDPMSTLKY